MTQPDPTKHILLFFNLDRAQPGQTQVGLGPSNGFYFLNS